MCRRPCARTLVGSAAPLPPTEEPAGAGPPPPGWSRLVGAPDAAHSVATSRRNPEAQVFTFDAIARTTRGHRRPDLTHSKSKKRPRRVLYPPVVRRYLPTEEKCTARKALFLLLSVVFLQVYNAHETEEAFGAEQAGYSLDTARYPLDQARCPADAWGCPASPPGGPQKPVPSQLPEGPAPEDASNVSSTGAVPGEEEAGPSEGPVDITWFLKQKGDLY